MFRRCIITIFQEYFEGYTQDNYLFAENDMDTLINCIYKMIKDKQFNTKEDVEKVLSDDFIHSLIVDGNFM